MTCRPRRRRICETTPLDMLSDPSRVVESGGFKAAMDAAEKQLLVDALRTSGGNKTAAANALGMKPSTFRDKLVKHGLQ